MRVGWFSAGCSSLVACKLARPDRTVYIHVTNQHPDTLRFLMDARTVLGEIEVIQSDVWTGVDEVLTTKGYVNGPSGASCSLELKKRVRQEWERTHFGPHTYIWGFDRDERRRAERIVETMPEFDHEFPLIERNLTKADCHAMCDEMGIRRPAMYDLGYPNNNCVGCVKGGMGYWNRIREDFPHVFRRRAREERLIGRSCMRGTFLDELEPGRGTDDVIVPDCSAWCVVASYEIDADDGV